MTTPSGTCGLSDIEGEFGGNPPTSLSEYYYGEAAYVPSSVPKKFNISLKDYDAAGEYVFVVPSDVTRIDLTVVGAGGGGGGNWSDGDLFWPGGGGSGGYVTQTINVIPGQTYTVIVGMRGLGGSYRFNSNYNMVPGNASSNGLAGGNSSFVGNGVNIVATGGGGGQGQVSFNNAGGAGGSPNGVAGQSSPGGYGQQCGGIRYGGKLNRSDGSGDGGNGVTCTRGADGTGGRVTMTLYSTIQNPISISQLRGKTSTLMRFPATSQSPAYDFYLGGPYGTGNPLRFSYSRSGTGAINYSLTFYNNYCGAAPTFTGSATPTTTISNGITCETFTAGQFSWRKGCCSGNDNYIYVTVQISMTSSGTVTASWVSTSTGNQQGC